jgi:hypothetical protein
VSRAAAIVPLSYPRRKAQLCVRRKGHYYRCIDQRERWDQISSGRAGVHEKGFVPARWVLYWCALECAAAVAFVTEPRWQKNVIPRSDVLRRPRRES